MTTPKTDLAASDAPLRCALWQAASPKSDLGLAIREAEAALAAAGALGAAVLVLPELWLPGYNQPDLDRHGMRADAPVFDRLAVAARAANCALVLGFVEAAEGVLYNTAMILFADGVTRRSYRKLQLYGPREKALFRPGDHYLTFPLADRNAAILICYDVEFAPHVAELAGQGVDLLLVPTANMQPFDHVVRHTVPAMAANHGLSIVYANYCGIEGDLTYVGGSLIAGPHGEVLAQAGGQPALLVADLPVPDPVRLSTQAADFRPVHRD